MTQNERQTLAALSTLILLQLIMLSSLYAGISPHPPAATPFFGIAPFVGGSVAIAVAAIIVKPLASKCGHSLSILAALTTLVSFGPQKYLDAQFALIWPAVILGQCAALVIFVHVVNAARQKGETDQVAKACGGLV
ncbi:MAG: hypothetical protein HWE23_06795 [Rhodobacteraceae bacterium]|nr:hypothetical protein [Paracoccaceae bacterium]